jgi:hypothetical protein
MTIPQSPLVHPAASIDGLWNQLTNAVTLVIKEDQIVWTIFGIFWAANVLLLGALFVTGDLPHRSVGLVVALIGILLSAMWWLVQTRALRYLAFYEAVQHALEAILLKDTPELSLSRSLNTAAFGRTSGTDISARTVMNASSALSLVLWFVALGVFACRSA